MHGSDVCRQRSARRGRAVEVRLLGIVGAIACRCVYADVVARVLRYDVDQTTSGVAAIQRALRAFENLNSLDIVEREGGGGGIRKIKAVRSEEHTSELQSLMRISYAVFCLKKKNT